MQLLNPASPAMQDIVVARCETRKDVHAMGQWLLPVLREWPPASWHLWLIDATDCGQIKAAKVGGANKILEWRNVEHEPVAQQDAVCSLLGGHMGLVVLAHHVVAASALRQLDGLVLRLTSFAATDPLARSFKKPFAAYGIALAA
jgi:hypothetical protein